MKYLAYIFLILAMGVAMLFGGRFAVTKFEASAGISSFIDYIYGESDLRARIAELEKENENLKAQILINKLEEPKAFKVYSIYPFNNLKSIAIAGGGADGVKEGSIVTYGRNIIIGKVSRVFDNYSIVDTVFDPGWKMEVRVGEGQTDGLFTGGGKMVLSYVAKKADIKSGDIVFTAGLGFPYGLEVGKIKEVADNPTSPLKEAIIDPAMRLNELRNVSIHP